MINRYRFKSDLAPRFIKKKGFSMSRVKIALVGKAGSGKDTVANILKEQYDIEAMALVDPIYKMANDLFKMQGKDRQLLRDIGKSLRAIDDYVFIKYLVDRVNNTSKDVIVTDVRLLKEYNRLRNEGFKFIILETDDENRYNRIKLRDSIIEYTMYDKINLENDPTELGVLLVSEQIKSNEDNYRIINNNGDMDSLHKQVIDIYNEFKGENK